MPMKWTSLTLELSAPQRVSINGLVGDDPNNPNDIGNAGVVTAATSPTSIPTNNVTELQDAFAVIDLTTFAASSIPGTDVGFAGVRDQIRRDSGWKVGCGPRRGPGALLNMPPEHPKPNSKPGEPIAIASRAMQRPHGISGTSRREETQTS